MTQRVQRVEHETCSAATASDCNGHVSLPLPVILGIETSCDETAAAVVAGDGRVVSSVVSSQHEIHGKYGGVVPELAARRQIEVIEVVTLQALDDAGLSWQDLNGVAVTQGPGLAGALLVGVSFAKATAYTLGIPLIGINHLEGHLASAWIDRPDFPPASIVLVVSGGHTHLFHVDDGGSLDLLGRTLDDAAGEAFDKAAKMLGLPYPGGPAIDRLARQGNAGAVAFPRSYLRKGSLDFSFSGLKTALLYYLRDLDAQGTAPQVPDIAASFQEAVVEVLVEKAYAAVKRRGVRALAVVGGVSANSRLRTLLAARAEAEDIQLSIPPLAYCTDNAAMIAFAGRRAFVAGRRAGWDLEAEPELELPARTSRDTVTAGHRHRRRDKSA